MRHPVAAGGKARIAREFRSAQHVEGAQPVLLVGAADDDPFVGGLERLIGRIERVRRTHGFRRHAGRKRDRRLPIGLHQGCLEQRGFHPLSLAGFQAVGIGGENAQCGEDAGGDVGQRRAAFHRRPVGPFTGEAHDPAHGLGHQIEAAAMLVGAGASKTRQRAVDQRGMVPGDVGVTEAELVHDAGAEILHQHVRRSDQAPQYPGAARLLEVERDALLVAVHHQERRRHVADPGRNHVAGVVAGRDLLDLDHLGAHVGEHQGAGRTRHDVREVDNLQSGQGAHGFSRGFVIGCCCRRAKSGYRKSLAEAMTQKIDFGA